MGSQSLLKRKKFDSSQDLKLMNNISPVRMLKQFRVALYTRQILIAKSMLKIFLVFHYQRQTFIFDNRTRKLGTKIIAGTKYIEEGVINSGVRYHNEIFRAIENFSKYSVTAKKYTQLFFQKISRRNQAKFSLANWRDVNSN